MDRDRVVTTALAAVDLLLWMGPESYTNAILNDRPSGQLVSPLAGQDFQTEMLDSMCVGPDMPANLHVTLRLATNVDHLVEAYCQVTCPDNDPRHIEAAVYVDGEYVIRRNVTVQSDGSLRPWGMPDELRLVDPGFQPLVCDHCGVTVMKTVRRGRYFTCEFAEDVINASAATMFYGRNPMPAMFAGHLEDDRHVICN